MNKQKRFNYKKIKLNQRKTFMALILFILVFFTSCKQEQAVINENIPISETVNIPVEDALIDSNWVMGKNIDDTNIESASDEVGNGPTEPEYSQITISMVGDVLIHDKVRESGFMADGSLDYTHVFAQVKEEISAVDLALVNQEVILGGKELGLSGYPCFNGAFEIGDALVDAGFDVVLHATNHTLDKGEKAVINCMDFWKTNHPKIAVLGINESQEAQDHNIYVYEKNGIKLAILNYTYSTNGIPLPTNMPYMVNLIDKDKIEQDVAKANELANFVIIAPHWGSEYTHTPSENQMDLAYFMADLGVDLVIGTHPHVIQPVEWIQSDNGNKMLIYYSIGNFINSSNEEVQGVADRMLGAIATVTIRKYPGEEAFIEEYRAIPTVTQVTSGPQLLTTYLFEDYSRELALENEVIGQDPAFTYDYCIDLWNETFPDFQYGSASN